MNIKSENKSQRIPHIVSMCILSLIVFTLPFTYCYSHKSSGYTHEKSYVNFEKQTWSLPSDVELHIVKHVIRLWDTTHELTRLDEQRTAVAIAKGLRKYGYAKWLFMNDWIELYIHRENPDRLISRQTNGSNEPETIIELNLIEFR